MSTEVSTSRIDEDEKDCKVAEVSRYSEITSGHRNPLLYNKGSVHKLSEPRSNSYCMLPTKGNEFHNEEIHVSALLSLPDLAAGPEVTKKDTLLSEAAMSNISELTSAERIAKVNNIFQLPLFEIRNTMQALIFRKRTKHFKNPPCPEPPESTNKNLLSRPVPRTPYKSRSLLTKEKQSFDKLGTELTPMQYQYFKHMYAIKTNYLNHVLNMRPIYFQYVSLSRENMSFINGQPFTSRVQQIMTMSKIFARDPSLSNKKTLVLDLDETLAHSSDTPLPNYDANFLYEDLNKNPLPLYVKLRPYLEEFLEDVSRKFELILYTAASQSYADLVIDFIERNKKYFAHRLYSIHCVHKPGVYSYKCLEVLCENRNIKDVVMVDNSVKNFVLSIRNGIPIKEFRGDETDTELIHLAKYLRNLVEVEDLRNVIKEDFAAFLLEHSHAN